MTDERINKALFYAMRIGASILVLWLYYKYGRTNSWICNTVSSIFKAGAIKTVLVVIVSNACRISILILYALIADYSLTLIEKAVTVADEIALVIINAIMIVVLLIAGWTLFAVGHFVVLLFEIHVCLEDKDATEN